MLLECPAYYLHCSVLKEFEFHDDNHSLQDCTALHGAKRMRDGTIITNECLVGKIITWNENGGRCIWSVEFSDGEVIPMACEELVAALLLAKSLGLNISGLT